MKKSVLCAGLALCILYGFAMQQNQPPPCIYCNPEKANPLNPQPLSTEDAARLSIYKQDQQEGRQYASMLYNKILEIQRQNAQVDKMSYDELMDIIHNGQSNSPKNATK